MPSDITEELVGLKKLLDEGALTQEEFEAAKKAVLSGIYGKEDEPFDGPSEEPEEAESAASSSAEKSKIVAGLLAIFLGAFGIHKFYLGYADAGVTMLLVSIFGSLLIMLGPAVMGSIALIEGIIYLSRSDQQFYETYVLGRKPWF